MFAVEADVLVIEQANEYRIIFSKAAFRFETLSKRVNLILYEIPIPNRKWLGEVIFVQDLLVCVEPTPRSFGCVCANVTKTANRVSTVSKLLYVDDNLPLLSD